MLLETFEVQLQSMTRSEQLLSDTYSHSCRSQFTQLNKLIVINILDRNSLFYAPTRFSLLTEFTKTPAVCTCDKMARCSTLL